jgi:hypothetical protein
MSTTELGELEALLERVLPDPRGFAQRVFEQIMQRLTTQVPDIAPIVDSCDAAAYRGMVERNSILATAVGACDCWGFEPGCPVCEGAGAAGWMRPDTDLYSAIIEPAVRRMTDAHETDATTAATDFTGR